MDLNLINLESFSSICRTCMGKGSLISLYVPNKKYSLKFSEMLSYCAAVEANEGDNLPSHICKKCKSNLVALYKFKHKAQDSDSAFRRLIDDSCKLNDFKLEDCDNSSSGGQSPTENGLDTLPGNDDQNSAFCELNGTGISLELKPEFKESVIRTEDIKIVKDENMNRTSTKRNRSIKKSLKLTAREKTYQCEVCGKFLSCRSNLVQHMRRHTGEKPFACDLCDKRFARAEHVTIHRRIHTGERPHSCSVCQKSFVQYAALTAHLRTHSGEKPHMCAICGKSFSQSVSLTYHMRTHTGETPFKCKLCNKGFAHSGNLNIHMRFHKNERPFVCTMCGRRFVTSSHLTVHIKQHTGDRPHQCKLCGKAFARSEHLKDHLVIHTGEKPHACKLCPKRYTQSSHLNRHMKSHKMLL